MVKQLKSCFCDERVNSGRQIEVDIAKGLSAVFMILCHTIYWLLDYSDFLSTVFVKLLGGPFAAPVFMFCMGLGIGYSSKNQPQDLLKRGLKLLWIGLLFGLARDVIPVLITWLLSGNNEVLTNLSLFFCADILRFAGLFFCFFAFLKKSNIKPIALLLLAVTFSCVGFLLQNISTGVFALDVLTGFLWFSWSEALFPLLNWFIFPVSGYLFSLLWQRCQDKETFYRYLTPVCGLISAVYLWSVVYFGGWYLSRMEYYGVGPLDAVFFLIIVLFLLGVSYYLRALPKRITAFLCRLGRNINAVYCIHWLLIYAIFLPSVYLFDWGYFPGYTFIPLGFGIVFLSDLLAQLFLRAKSSRQGTNK